jgi:hypothetical protein
MEDDIAGASVGMAGAHAMVEIDQVHGARHRLGRRFCGDGHDI